MKSASADTHAGDSDVRAADRAELHARLLDGFCSRYATALRAKLSQKGLDALEQASKAVLDTVLATAPMRGVTEPALLDQLLDGFFGAQKAEKNRFWPGYLRDPVEWLPGGKGPKPAAPGSALEKIESELSAVKRARRNLELKSKRTREEDGDLYELEMREADLNLRVSKARAAA